MRRVVIAIVGAVVCVGFASTASAQDPKVDKGMQVYAAQKCSLCHSVAGKGNAKGPLDDVGSKLSTADIHQWIVDPTAMTAKTKAERKPPMPAKYKALPKDDLDALVAYLGSLKKK